MDKKSGDDHVKKRLVFAICLMVCVLLPAIALAAPAPEQEAAKLMAQFDEARQKIEARIDYPTFCTLRRELSQATRLFREKYPEAEATRDFVYLSQLYADIEDTWQLKAERNVKFLPKTKDQGQAKGSSPYFINTVMLKMSYPDVLNASLESKEYGYFVNSVLDNLLGHAVNVTKAMSGKWLK